VLPPRDWHNFATKYEKQGDNSLLAGGDVKPYGVTHLWVDTELTNITGFQLEALLHPNLPNNGPGLTGYGSFWEEFTCEAYAIKNPTVTNKVTFTAPSRIWKHPVFAATNMIDGNTEKGGWTP